MLSDPESHQHTACRCSNEQLASSASAASLAQRISAVKLLRLRVACWQSGGLLTRHRNSCNCAVMHFCSLAAAATAVRAAKPQNSALGSMPRDGQAHQACIALHMCADLKTCESVHSALRQSRAVQGWRVLCNDLI